MGIDRLLIFVKMYLIFILLFHEQQLNYPRWPSINKGNSAAQAIMIII